MPMPGSRLCPHFSYTGAWTLTPGSQLCARTEAGEAIMRDPVQIFSWSDMIFPIVLTFVQNAPWRHVYRVAISADDILHILWRCHIGSAIILSCKVTMWIGYDSAALWVRNQAILDWQLVREAEAGLGRGENTSSLQHCHFGIAAEFYTISNLCWHVVEICFITTNLFIKTNSF